MSVAALAKEISKLREQLGTVQADQTLSRLQDNPTEILIAAGMQPDPWQEKILRSHSGQLSLLCSRQSGKSLIASAIALYTAFFEAPALILLLSPTLRQSGELFRDKVMHLYRLLGRPIAGNATALTLTLANGSRIISLPGAESNILGYSSVRLLIIDEAARVPDTIYYAVRPFLAVSQGRLMALSSAYAKMGWFYNSWQNDNDDWERVRITADQCPRITPAFLKKERSELDPRRYAMEYFCEWGEMIDSVFSEADIAAAMDDSLKPLFVG